ncbi:MAG: hypothetical protein EOO28_23735 [Comamonadaceae bacterium]|nr:MAG: hypothetical protein EOO28_23735 [Comamonadaceae bacterium]
MPHRRRPAASHVFLRTTALFGLWSLIPYAVYLLVVVWLSVRVSLVCTLSAATLAWAIAAGVLLVVWTRAYPAGCGVRSRCLYGFFPQNR